MIFIKKAYSSTYISLREFLDSVPVIESHEHYFGTTDTQPSDAINLLVSSYSSNDFSSISREALDNLSHIVLNKDKPFDERYAYFCKLYEKTKHTAYCKSVEYGIKECWGIDDYSRESILSMQERINAKRSNEFYQQLNDRFLIKAKIIDTCTPEIINRFAKNKGFLEGYSPDCRFAFSLPNYHFMEQEHMAIHLEKYTGQKITDLDAYMIAFETHLKECIDAGIICLKDQSAYTRKIQYEAVDKDTANSLFDKLIKENKPLEENEALILSNYLMRSFMSLAQKHKLPVQLHTGHLAMLNGEISKTNAVNLSNLLRDFPDVNFDLFHGNWPYMGEYLFLGKSYPNVTLDLCWVQSIDPAYCVELMKRAIMTLPHNKLIAFGGDDSVIEHIVGYLIMARDNVASALTDLIDMGWLSMSDARQIALDWFYNNPNEIFKLGFETLRD